MVYKNGEKNNTTYEYATIDAVMTKYAGMLMSGLITPNIPMTHAIITHITLSFPLHNERPYHHAVMGANVYINPYPPEEYMADAKMVSKKIGIDKPVIKGIIIKGMT